MAVGQEDGVAQQAEHAAGEAQTFAPTGRDVIGWQRRSPTARVAMLAGGAVLLAGLYAIGALLPFWYLNSPEEGAAFFPAAGITLVALGLTPRRTWPLWLAVIAVTELVVDLTHGQSLALAVGFAAANTVEPFVGASLLRSRSARPPASFQQRLVRYLLAAVVIGPMVGGLLGATTAVAFGDATSWLVTTGKWWLGDGLGVLVVATPILAWLNRNRFEAAAHPLELLAMSVLAVGVTLVPAVLWHDPVLYAIFPILIWAALRGGSRAVSTTGLAIAFAANWAAVSGRADDLITPGLDQQDLVFVQIFLGISLIAALVLAVEVAERRRSEEDVRRAEAERNKAERLAVDSAQEERRRIARETHDIVGHALNVILLQAGAARRAVESDPAAARASLETLEKVGRDAFRDLDVALALDGDAAGQSGEGGMNSLPELVSVLRLGGLDVTLDIEGEPRNLPALLDRSAFRIVQEALTNVVKHSAGTSAHVTICFEPDRISLRVVSEGARRNGSAPSQARPGGRGVVGMRERAQLLGGHLEAGPQGHTFVVEADLPARPRRLPAG